MKKIDKEYYEKLKAINYNKVETTLYEKLKDYGIWEVKERIEKAEDHLLSYNNRIEYIKKYIKKNIKKYYEDDFTINFNEELEEYEILYGEEIFPISVIPIYNKENGEVERIEVSHEKETFFIDIPQEVEHGLYNYYFLPPNPDSYTSLEEYFKKTYNYDEDIMILEKGTYCYEYIEELMILTAYILLKLQDPTWERGLDLASLKFPENIGLNYIKEPRFKFENRILDLMNRFNEDELLAFILFAFDFNYYLKKEKKILMSPLPNSLSKLSFKLLDIKDNDYVLNFYSELGNFAIESFLNSPSINIRGIEDFFVTRNISILKAILISDNIKFSDITPNYFEEVEFEDIEIDSCIEVFRIKPAFEYSPKQKVDKIFSNLALISNYFFNSLYISKFYQYNKRGKEEVTEIYKRYLCNDLKISNEIVENASLEWLSYIKIVEEQLKDEGKALSLVESEILYDYNNNEKIREYFIKKGYIEAIILLPENIMFDVNTSLALIVFSKGNKKIRFVDASNFGKAKKIKEKNITILRDSDVDEIINLLNNDTNSKVAISKEIKDFSENYYNLGVDINIDPSSIDPSKKTIRGIPLKKLIKNIMRGTQISTEELEEYRATEKTSNIYLSISDINDELIDFNNIETYLKNIPENQEKFLVKNEYILLSKYGKSPKLAIAKNLGEEKVIASGNLIIIEVDEKKIDPYYLAALFSSKKGIKILKEAYSIKDKENATLSIKKLKELRIPIPSQKICIEIACEYERILSRINRKKLELKELIDSKEEILKKLKVEV
ncbi:N-6 DNA methylase [Fusobacterium animalis]|uniref:site-specific DNA-methyltransferase (adenine-specific) n=1 Tax=Fusobacterium animalis TaxID=76859 RepID=A0A2B7YU09_9FUSO|nr:N-6 DNA methylase [Fusobacterium animalis]PGH24368.1 hypothetical protein RN90_02335 [Fusobacterium animalis]